MTDQSDQPEQIERTPKQELREAAGEVRRAFGAVESSMHKDKNPGDTARALRKASQEMAAFADRLDAWSVWLDETNPLPPKP